MKTSILVCFLLGFSILTEAQKNPIIVSPNIALPKDTILINQLLKDLNGFLSQVEMLNSENEYVLSKDLLETSIFIDELKGLGRSSKFNSENFYKIYLSNVARLRDSSYVVQISYMGVNENNPMLKVMVSMIAIPVKNHFYFKSPLKRYTSNWKHEQIGNIKVYFKDELNLKNAKVYFNKVKEFDNKLKVSEIPIEYYCAENMPSLLQLIGIDYKSDYNGSSYGSTSAKENGMQLVVNGEFGPDFKGFDPHDLWHARLHNIVSTSIINRPVDEGTACLYGGSWGLTWEQILEKFKAFAKDNPKADWITLYNESKNFDEKAKYPLNVDHIINALIVRRLEKEKGFNLVIDLLSCGKLEKGNENYFKALEKIAGISKANFNEEVWKMIAEK